MKWNKQGYWKFSVYSYQIFKHKKSSLSGKPRGQLMAAITLLPDPGIRQSSKSVDPPGKAGGLPKGSYESND